MLPKILEPNFGHFAPPLCNVLRGDVDQGGLLLSLEEIDDCHHVEKEAEAGIMNPLTVSHAANTLTVRLHSL